MIYRASLRRSGFTLLEVLLASVIAILLMAGLYVALDVQLRQANEARQIVQQATIARSVINRISTDLTPVLTPVSQTASSSGGSSGGMGGSSDSSGSSGSGGTGGSTGTGGTGGTGGGSTGGSTGSSNNSANATADPGLSDTGPTATANNTYYPPQIGVVGDSSYVMLFVTRVPNSSTTITESSSDLSIVAPDIRRVTYLVEEGTGLIRQQSYVLTADSTMESESNRQIVASEVTGIEFRYWDGTGWLSTWDGSALSDDMQTPIGPPMAIEVRIWIKQPNRDDPVEFRHTIALHTAPTPVQTTTSTIQPIP